MKKRFINTLLIIAVLIFTAVSFAGCTQKAQTAASGNEKSAANEGSGFQKLKDRGYVTVGLDDTFVPMGFRNEKDEIVGFDVDLAKEVFKRIGLEIKFQPIDWSMKETELNSENIDLIWNGYSITDERKEKVNFSNPYLVSRQVVVTLADSEINSKKDLAGKVVATQNGSSSIDAINTEPELAASFKNGAPVLFDTNNEALMDLDAGRTDAVVADELLIKYYINQRGKEKYKILSEDFGKETYGVGFRKTDTELLDKVNKALEDMKTDGTSAQISEKWLGDNIVK